MNTRHDGTRHDGGRHDRDEAFDRAMRQRHAQALTQVSAQTRARLRAARTAAVSQRAPMRGFGWALASGCAAIVALAIGLQLRAPSSTASLPTQIAATEAASYAIDGTIDTLDENPDLYLWLAFNDDTLPVAWER